MYSIPTFNIFYFYHLNSIFSQTYAFQKKAEANINNKDKFSTLLTWTGFHFLNKFDCFNTNTTSLGFNTIERFNKNSAKTIKTKSSSGFQLCLHKQVSIYLTNLIVSIQTQHHWVSIKPSISTNFSIFFPTIFSTFYNNRNINRFHNIIFHHLTKNSSSTWIKQNKHNIRFPHRLISIISNLHEQTHAFKSRNHEHRPNLCL